MTVYHAELRAAYRIQLHGKWLRPYVYFFEKNSAFLGRIYDTAAIELRIDRGLFAVLDGNLGTARRRPETKTARRHGIRVSPEHRYIAPLYREYLAYRLMERNERG